MLHCNRNRRSSCALGAAFAATVTLAAFVPSAHAGDIVYDNNAGGAAGINGAILSDLDNSSVGIFRINADDFTLVSGAAIAGIEWTGIYAHDLTPPATDDFTIEIYADAAGFMPQGGAPLHSFNVGNAVNRTDSGFNRPSGADIFNYSASINFVAPANTTLWVSIFDNTVGENDDFFWAMLTSGGNSYFSSNEGGTWSPAPYRQDFRLLDGDATGVVTFENLVIDRLDLAGPQSEGGFTYEAVSGEGWELVSAFGNPPSSLATVFNDEDSNVGDTVEIHAGGQLFTFNSVDYRALVAGIPDVVQISGFRDGSFIDVLPLDTPSTTSFQTVASGFTEQIDLLRVRVTSDNTSALLLDNFDLTLAPAPGVAITFENLVIDRLDLAGPQSENGFTYEAVTGQGWELVSQFGNAPSSLATAFNDENSPVGSAVEIDAGGQLFSFTSVDFRSLVGGIPDQITISGFRDGGLIDTLLLSNPSTTAFQTLASGFNDDIDLLRVEVTSDGSAAMFLDNFALAIVPVACPADLANNDNVVDVFDLFVLLGNWGTSGTGADLATPNNTVDVFDLFVLLSAWGDC